MQGEKKPFLTTTAVNATLSEADGRVTSLLYARFPYADRTQALLYTGKAELLYDWKREKPYGSGAALPVPHIRI